MCYIHCTIYSLCCLNRVQKNWVKPSSLYSISMLSFIIKDFYKSKSPSWYMLYLNPFILLGLSKVSFVVDGVNWLRPIIFMLGMDLFLFFKLGLKKKIWVRSSMYYWKVGIEFGFIIMPVSVKG